MSPAETERQRKLFCVALAIKQGLTPKSYSAEAAKMADEMTEAQLKEFCKSEAKS